MIEWGYWLEFWYLFPISAAICLMVCVIGIEGAVLFVPFFALLFPIFIGPMVAVEAVAIGLITEVFGFASALIAWWRAGLIDFKIGKRAAILSIPTAFVGGILSYYLPSVVLLVIIGIGMGIAGLAVRRVKIAHPEPVEPEATSTPQSTTATDRPDAPPTNGGGDEASTGDAELHRTIVDRWGREYVYQYVEDLRRRGVIVFGGLFEGLTGFGIGVLGVADLIIRDIPPRVAIGTSHAIIAVTAIAAALPHAWEVSHAGAHFRWNIIAMTVPAVIIMAQASAYVAGYLPQQKTKRYIAWLLIILGVATLGRAASLVVGCLSC